MFAKSHDDLAKIENFLSRQSSKFRNCGQIYPQYSLRDNNKICILILCVQKQKVCFIKNKRKKNEQ